MFTGKGLFSSEATLNNEEGELKKQMTEEEYEEMKLLMDIVCTKMEADSVSSNDLEEHIKKFSKKLGGIKEDNDKFSRGQKINQGGRDKMQYVYVIK